MKNKSLAQDYIIRAGHRLEALALLMKRESFADVVREAQEIVELSLKALLRKCRMEVPRLHDVHDVSDILIQEEKKLPATIRSHLKRLCHVSKHLRRDRELAFSGAEDLTPSDFYQKSDAEEALADATWVYKLCHSLFL